MFRKQINQRATRELRVFFWFIVLKRTTLHAVTVHVKKKMKQAR